MRSSLSKLKARFSGRLSFAVLILCAALLLLILRLFLKAPPEFLLSQDEKFERFTEEIFRSEMSGSTLNLHYTIAEPESFKIKTTEVSLGNASLAARKNAAAAAENYLNTLKSFDYEKLSDKHRLTYEIFRDHLETELAGSSYLLYDEPLSPTLGIQAQLPILFAEYAFRTKGDIEDYLTLLSRIPDYFSSILSFERDKAAAGLFMSPDCAQEVVRQCEEFIRDPKQNYLITIFNEKIDAVTNLTADEKIAYKNRNETILTGYVIPAYQELGTKLSSYAGSSKNSMGLYYLPEGTSYYQYLIKRTVGDDRPVEKIEEAIKKQMVEDFTAIRNMTAPKNAAPENTASENTVSENAAPENTASENTAPENAVSETHSGTDASVPVYSSAAKGMPLDMTALANCHGILRTGASEGSGTQDDTLADTASASPRPAAMLAELREKITKDFPVLPDVSCDIKYVHESLQKYLSPAFYLTPAIDDYKNNVIYINPDSNYDDIELFTTLAHEGYPGHLYQSVYWNDSKPDLLRMLLDVGGYTEGWATYVEMYSFGLWDENPPLAKLYQKNRSFTLGLASLLDIGIHYRGYTKEDVAAFLGKLGFPSSTADALYQGILHAPANYLKYYVGYLNFCELRDDVAAVQKENFSLREFHRMILETGPAPFPILRRELSRRLSK